MNNGQKDRTAVDWALLSVRVAVALILVAHGSQKLLGAFGGGGLADTVAHMGTLGYFVSVGEFFGGLGLLLGVLPRFSAAANIAIMLGAIATVHGKNGFFLANQGFEYNIAIIGLLLPVLIAGPGRFAVSELIPLRRFVSRRAPSQAGA
jgi:putative oxidoreductase